MGERTHAGWRSRGYLPHFDAPNLIQHIVFGLADALPPGERNEADLDKGHGECLLRDARIASIAEATLLHEDGERYRLIAWCVMPNHVHAIFEQLPGAPLADVLQSWKSVSAHRINALLGRKGRLWRREYFDRYMRDVNDLRGTVAYVHCNPVEAGLCKDPADWRFSSAYRRWHALERGDDLDV